MVVRAAGVAVGHRPVPVDEPDGAGAEPPCLVMPTRRACPPPPASLGTTTRPHPRSAPSVVNVRGRLTARGPRSKGTDENGLGREDAREPAGRAARSWCATATATIAKAVGQRLGHSRGRGSLCQRARPVRVAPAQEPTVEHRAGPETGSGLQNGVRGLPAPQARAVLNGIEVVRCATPQPLARVPGAVDAHAGVACGLASGPPVGSATSGAEGGPVRRDRSSCRTTAPSPVWLRRNEQRVLLLVACQQVCGQGQTARARWRQPSSSSAGCCRRGRRASPTATAPSCCCASSWPGSAATLTRPSGPSAFAGTSPNWTAHRQSSDPS